MGSSEIIKFVFTGSVGSGKTTAIATISEASHFSTEVKPSEQSVLKHKSTTTVAMDYGVIKTIDGNDKLYLYGTPGQRRFDFMTPILTKDATGIIIMINNNHENPLAELDYYLDLNAEFLLDNPAVIGITHYDKTTRPSIDDYYCALQKRGAPWSVIHVDAREIGDITLLLDTLIATLEYG
ncbi:MAG: GTP-binding protein [Methylococcaceae bacterium]